MLRNPMKLLALAAAVVMTAALGAGCSSGSKKGNNQDAAAKVSVSVQSAAIADIASIKVTVADNGVAPNFGTFDFVLNKAPSGNVWTGSVSQIPASPAPGSARRFKAEAFNAASVKIYEGDSIATVIAGQTAQVTIILQELNVPVGPTNYAPVITSLSVSNAYVLPGQTGTMSVSASDPDNNGADATRPLLYAWSASCTAGTLAIGDAAAASTTFQVPTENSVCTVSIKVSENPAMIAQPLSVTTYFTITVNANFGNADIAAFPNSYPIITVRGDFRYNFFSDVTTIPVGQQGDLFFHAIDPDGDNVRFNLSAKCGADLTAAAASAKISDTYFSTVTLTTAAGTVPAASAFDWSPFFGYNGGATYTNPADDCIFRIDVKDLCTAGNCGAAGSQGALADGADKVTTIDGVAVSSLTTGFINATHPAQAKRAPVIVRVNAPNQLGPNATGVQTWDPPRRAIVQPSAQYLLQAEADDRYENGTLTATWNCANGTLAAPVNTGNLKTSVQWTSPAALTVGMQCTVTFTSTGATGSGLSTVATFQFGSSDACVGQPDGTTCNDGNACTTGESCQSGVCTVPTGGTTTCSALDTCHDAGVCNPLDGTCSNPAKANGSVCDADSNGCTVGDSCQAGVCTAGAAASCNSAPNNYCYNPAGACTSTSNATFACNYTVTTGASCTVANAGTKCNGADQFASFACDAGGACVGSGSVVCANTTCASGNVCQSASGACGGGSNQPTTTPCDDGNGCTGTVAAPDHCDGAGACAPGGPKCPAGQSCDPVTFNCTAPAPTIFRALDLRLTPPGGVAIDTAGNSYVAGVFGSISPVDFQTRSGGPAINLTSQGASDGFVAKYDVNGDITWAVLVGDNVAANATDQTFTQVAVTQSGRVGVIGKFAGTVTFGTTSAGGANPLPIVGALNGADGSRAWVNGYDLGSNGLFQVIATNPSETHNRIAACGFADGAATTLDSSAVYGGSQDAVIGAWDAATGAKLWGHQFGTTALNENCGAVTVDANGDVIAAGQFDGATIDLGNGHVLTGPNSTARKFMWIAKFNGATGATMAATLFNGTLGNAIPRSLAIAPNGDIAIGGSFTGNLTIGAAITTAGSEDGFIALLDAGFTPVWNAVRIGGTALDLVRSVAFTSAGDIMALGNFAASSATFRNTNGADTTGLAALTSAGGIDAMVIKLNGQTGATDQAKSYGNAGTQSGDVIAVNRFGADQFVFSNTSGGTVVYDGQSFTATGANDVALAFGHMQ